MVKLRPVNSQAPIMLGPSIACELAVAPEATLVLPGRLGATPSGTLSTNDFQKRFPWAKHGRIQRSRRSSLCLLPNRRPGWRTWRHGFPLEIGDERLRSTRSGSWIVAHLVYYVFDLLYLDGHDLRGLPLIRRKAILQQVLPTMPGVLLCEHIEDHGLASFDAVAKAGLEGMVAKDGSSK